MVGSWESMKKDKIKKPTTNHKLVESGRVVRKWQITTTPTYVFSNEDRV